MVSHLTHSLPSEADLTLDQRLSGFFKDVPQSEEAEADPLKVCSRLTAQTLGVRLRLSRLFLQGLWLDGDSLAPFVVTPMENVVRGLSLAGVTAIDTLLDVGCGDGRVVVAAAALCGCHARGVEIDPHVAQLAQAAVEAWRPVGKSSSSHLFIHI